MLTNIDEIRKYFPKMTKANVKTFLSIATSMIILRTTSLYKCKDKMGEITGKKKTQAMSHYKKILRFFLLSNVQCFCEGIFYLIFSMFHIDTNRIVIDRTNWKIGKKNVNILTAGVIFLNCFIPLCWQQMNKRGNSNFYDRQILMDRFIRLWTLIGKNISGMVVIADREFIGPKWLSYLNKNQLSYVFRLKDNMYFELFGNQVKKTTIAQLRWSY
jgi:hypothetical protein